MIPYLYCVNNKSDHITEIALLLTVTFYNFQGLMTNPEALQAINQVQEGLARLQRVPYYGPRHLPLRSVSSCRVSILLRAKYFLSLIFQQYWP